jgi:1-pyrroline-5-carboxylate dehydrogenase
MLLRRFINPTFISSRALNVRNEPVLQYCPGSEEREKLLREVDAVKSRIQEIPIVIGGSEYNTDNVVNQVSPYDHQRIIATSSYASKALIDKAIDNALEAREKWDNTPVMERVKVFLKAADRIATDLRPKINAATMVGQGKNIVQAEVDAACELIDFLRFNSMYALQLDSVQPLNTPDANNQSVYRGLEGFVAAITPFNFTAIAGNLPSAPAMVGNVALWKPSDTSLLSNWIVYQTFIECGLPDGVIQFIPAVGTDFGDVTTESADLAAINFTGSTSTFKTLWRKVSENLDNYRTFPKIIGETGGKNFHFVHPSADLDSVVGGTIRSTFEYQGQKCSACSRMYVPKSKWGYLKQRLIEEVGKVKVGPADDPRVLVSAVIDAPAFKRISAFIDYANNNDSYNLVVGGTYDDSVGYFVQPTIYEVSDPNEKLMKEEIFGPVLTIFVYEDSDAEKMLDIVDKTSPYSLTGAIFSADEKFLALAQRKLRYSVGNMYINDKCTGSVVAQQPFGGARMSGTNDKAGSPSYVMRFCSPLAIKTAIGDRHIWTYPSMQS